ncbi:Ribosomal protein [Trema orientale]|uniref:Ribosomal protein n=1 Tax=Trema orientale TaxID=63057 RepID=A0A2P5D3F4_TREOI|nr:Ribosomal protein [Trema orientale]
MDNIGPFHFDQMCEKDKRPQRHHLHPHSHRTEKMAQTLAMPVAPSLSVICNGRTSNPLSNRLSFPIASPPKIGGLSVKCARVGGVEIPNNKRIEFSLQYIHGIGRTRARKILNDLSIENKLTKDFSEEELVTIRDEVSKYMIEGDLRRFNALAIRRLKEIQCYRGIRHIQGLPCRGQRTKNNCRTLKGKRVAIAGKKKASR